MTYNPMSMLEELLLPMAMPIFGGTCTGNTPLPVKQVQRAIAAKAIVITVDEFRFSGPAADVCKDYKM